MCARPRYAPEVIITTGANGCFRVELARVLAWRENLAEPRSKSELHRPVHPRRPDEWALRWLGDRQPAVAGSTVSYGRDLLADGSRVLSGDRAPAGAAQNLGRGQVPLQRRPAERRVLDRPRREGARAWRFARRDHASSACPDRLRAHPVALAGKLSPPQSRAWVACTRSTRPWPPAAPLAAASETVEANALPESDRPLGCRALAGPAGCRGGRSLAARPRAVRRAPAGPARDDAQRRSDSGKAFASPFA